MRNNFSPQRHRGTEFFEVRRQRTKLNNLAFLFSSSFNNLFLSIFTCGLILLLPTFAHAQKVAVLAPETTSQSKEFSENFTDSLSKRSDIVDSSLATSIFEINKPETPFNLNVQDAINLGVNIGCNFFILIKTDTLRRSSFARKEYYEAFAIFYLVSSRTGRLTFWKIQKFEEDTPKQAKSRLFDSIDSLSNEISNEIKKVTTKELSEKEQKISEFPDADSPEAKGLRPPLPYKRLKPEYTAMASLYSLVATVDVLVDIDENGKVLQTEIVRWAGYGLDESVIENVKRMNWRPADRDGKKLPMRILLRYNFKNIETEE